MFKMVSKNSEKNGKFKNKQKHGLSIGGCYATSTTQTKENRSYAYG